MVHTTASGVTRGPSFGETTVSWRTPAIRTQVSRRGFLMPLVLIVVASVTLTISLFAEHMLAEYEAAHRMVRQLPMSAGAQSGIEQIKVLADDAFAKGRYLCDLDSKAFSVNKLSATSDVATAIAIERHGNDQNVTFGIINESSKLNVNSLPTDSSHIELARNRLMALPRMTPQIADAIMDWIDADESPRPFGAEKLWYTSQAAPHLPAQGPIKHLTELLHVRGVTQELLFGEDTNANDWLDTNEDDGSLTLPNDNHDGRLDKGWSAYLTVYGKESNLGSRGQPKINLNQSDLAKLYDQLIKVFSPKQAQFVVALRLEGPHQRGVVKIDSLEKQIAERKRTSEERLKSQLESSSSRGNQRFSATRAGLDLGKQPAFTFRSVVDLVNQEVLTIIDKEQQLLVSPWTLSNLDASLQLLEATLAVSDAPDLNQRININSAPTVVLQTIPGLDRSLARNITTHQRRHASAKSIAWLVNDGLIDFDAFREIAPLITVGGQVYSGMSLGIDHARPIKTDNRLISSGIHFVIDGSQAFSRVIEFQDTLPFTVSLAQGSK